MIFPPKEIFNPATWASSPHLQTIFGSLKFRAPGKNEMVNTATEVILDAGSGVRLLGYHSRQSLMPARGMIILLHGWEGSSDSTYILSTGRFFYRKGYDIFRLNLRDHGKSHHLNQGLFHGALIEETHRAVESISRFLPMNPCYIIGFSLGGNFALRIAIRQNQLPMPNLMGIFCISPALDPYKATLAIDSKFPLYRHYFLTKWKRSLRTKQRCFPDIYHFDDILHHRTCMDLTAALMTYYTEWQDYREYFQNYTLTGEILAGLETQVTIITSQDDPFIDVNDFYLLPDKQCLKLLVQKHGGHCGFLDPFPYECWYERAICTMMEDGEVRRSYG